MGVDLRAPPAPQAPQAHLSPPARRRLVASTVEEDHPQVEEEIRPQAVAVDLRCFQRMQKTYKQHGVCADKQAGTGEGTETHETETHASMARVS